MFPWDINLRTAATFKHHDNFFVICCKHHVFSVSSQFCKNIGPNISATITFRNMLEEVVVEVMDGMEKFFKITSCISIILTMMMVECSRCMMTMMIKSMVLKMMMMMVFLSNISGSCMRGLCQQKLLNCWPRYLGGMGELIKHLEYLHLLQ